MPEYRTAVQLDPNDEASRIALVNALQDSGDLDAAIAESNEAIRIWPDRPYFHYLLGRVLVRKNDPDGAVVELQWALQKTKNHFSPVNCELGRAYELRGDLRAALGQYRTAYRAHVDDLQCRAGYQRLELQLKK
jgi:tetratricopeptide (TPR) repeat protein